MERIRFDTCNRIGRVTETGDGLRFDDFEAVNHVEYEVFEFDCETVPGSEVDINLLLFPLSLLLLFAV